LQLPDKVLLFLLIAHNILLELFPGVAAVLIGNPDNFVDCLVDLFLIGWGDFDAVYACGPEAMLDRLAEMCMGRYIPCQLSRESYMRCGLGICGSCQRGGMLVCRDGPVFTLPMPGKRRICTFRRNGL